MEMLSSSDAVYTAPKSLIEIEKAQPSAALNRLQASGCLSEDGKNWFILATDPFHDERLTLSGYPDTNVSGSVIQCVKQSVQISAPSTAPYFGDNWDCHITNFPFFQSIPGVNYGVFNSSTQTGPAQDTFLAGGLTTLAGGFVSVNGGETGLPIWSDTVGNAGPIVTVGLDDAYTTGQYRVIGMGFEVTNTTAPLYMQGQVTCYRQPAPVPDQRGVEHFDGTLGTESGTLDVYRCRCPPKTLAEAMLLEGSATWEASKGCYVVSTLNQLENPSTQPQAVAIALDQIDQFIDTGGFPNDFYISANVGTLTAPVTSDQYIGVVVRSNVLPYNMAGAYFTGLSATTTLQLTTKYFIERFPDPSNTDLVVLAQPSSGFDPCALELYAHTISRMPVGVPQGENSLGDWFKQVVNKVTGFTTPILKFLAPAHPLIGGAAVLSGAAKALSSQNSAKAQRRLADFESLGEHLGQRRERRIVNRARKRSNRRRENGSMSTEVIVQRPLRRRG